VSVRAGRIYEKKNVLHAKGKRIIRRQVWETHESKQQNVEFIKHLAWRTERKWRAQTGVHANANTIISSQNTGNTPHFPNYRYSVSDVSNLYI